VVQMCFDSARNETCQLAWLPQIAVRTGNLFSASLGGVCHL
jgi:hypothetical protein